MALSESGLGGVGPMVIQGPGGRRVTVKPKSAKGKRNYYVIKPARNRSPVRKGGR